MDNYTRPADIEKRSFEMITDQLTQRQFDFAAHDSAAMSIILRVIHTTADFDYAANLVFSPGVIKAAQAALKAGSAIVTDTKMALSGINKKALEQLGCTAQCFIDAPEVVERAHAEGTTRARAAIDYAAQTLPGPIIFAIGNAPTALIRIHELVSEGQLAPALVVGVPVGFVNVVESKELICSLATVPHIVARGQKGGSNVAAAIMNALTYGITAREI
ncbi:MAG: precorrin-8X methylmutase [Coriobacteriia bacterium]|nr:precorrin-8X methylmutase [Coriobacteriia bacterium]